jgi:L-gulonate 5-dehydrogenase
VVSPTPGKITFKPVITDVLENKLKAAKEVGVKYTVNAAKEKVSEKIKEFTCGRMAECVLEATGVPGVIESLFDIVSYAGRVAFVGWPNKKVQIATSIFTLKELDVMGSRVNTKEQFKNAMKLMAKEKIDTRSIISDIVSYKDIPYYVKDIVSNGSKYIKIVGIWD